MGEVFVVYAADPDEMQSIFLPVVVRWGVGALLVPTQSVGTLVDTSRLGGAERPVVRTHAEGGCE